MENLQKVIDKLDELSQEIEQQRPISPELEKRIMDKFRLDWNYHSNNIEGNSLTFGETKTFILHGITAHGKPLKDHLDLKGHNEAIHLIEETVKEKRPLTESFIRELHLIILHEPYDVPAITPEGKPTSKQIHIGAYKTQPNHVLTETGETFYFASPDETPARMHDLLEWYRKAKDDKELHPLILASKFHYDFILIHPFDDGNGRMARLLMNLIFISKKFPPVIIMTEDKENYFRALQLADGGEMEAFYIYVGEQLIRSMEIVRKGALGEDVDEMGDAEKELSILKTRLNANIQIKRSRAVQKKVLDESLRPFLENLYSTLKKIDDLFGRSSITLEGNSYSPFTMLISKLQNDFSRKDFEKKIIQFKWEYFEHGNTQFKLFTDIEFRFSPNRYFVTSNDVDYGFNKLYNEVISKAENHKFTEDILKVLNYRIKKGIVPE